MRYILISVLALASICSINGYGPPPRKTKHRTTTTTETPIETYSNSPSSNSIYPSEAPIDRTGNGPYPSGPHSSSPNSQSSQPSGNNYWWQGPSSPFNPQQSLPVSPNQEKEPSSGQGSPSGAYPGQGSYPSQSSPSGSYPAQGSPCGSNLGQSSPCGSYPSQGQPGAYPSQGSNPNQSTSSGTYPSGSPSGSLPGQGSPSGSYPDQSGSYPSQGSSGSQPGLGSPIGSYPGQGAPSGSYPNQGSPSGPQPGQGSPVGLQPTQGSAGGTYPNSASGSYPNQGSPSGPYPGQGTPIGSHPTQGSPTGSYPSSPTGTSTEKPIDLGSNPFLSSALGINKPTGNCGSSSGCGNQGPYQSAGNPNSGANPNQPQYPGGNVQPQVPGNNQGHPQYPGNNQEQPQYPGSNQGQPQYPESNQGQPQYPGSNLGQPQYPGSNQGQPQYPGSNQGQPQYPGSNQGQPQYPESNQGQPQYPGSNQGQPQYTVPSQPGFGGKPTQPSYPQGQPQTPDNPPQYSTAPSAPSQQPQYGAGSNDIPSDSKFPPPYPGASAPAGHSQTPNNPAQYGGPSGPVQQPQYGNGPNNTPGGSKFPPPYPGASAPAGQLCNKPGYLCVSASACTQGILSENGVPGRAGICNVATEVCCQIPSSTNSGAHSPSIGYGNGKVPGTNGVPIGGSIYDKPKPQNYVTPSAPAQPYTGPLNTTPHPGCPAALKCVPISYCTAEGVMADSPVSLTREQQENRVPLTDCMNTETNVIGKCCRDPNYKDPWPAGMMMAKNPTGDGQFDDGQYHPPGSEKFDDGQYHPPSDDKSDSQYNQPEQETSDTLTHQAGLYYNVISTTPKGHTIKKPIGNFNQNPTPFPIQPSAPGTQGRLPAPVYENNDNPAPSNEIVPPDQGQINKFPGYPNVPPSQSTFTQQSYQPTQPGSGPGQTYQPTFSQQPSQSVTPSVQQQPNYQPQSPIQQNINPNQPGQVTSYQPRYPESQNTIPSQSYQSTTSNFYPGQSNPTHPGSPVVIGNQNPGQQPNYPFKTSPQPDFPTGSNKYQPNPSGILNSYTPNANEPGKPTNGPQATNRIPPGTTCGIRHQAYSNSPDEAGETEFPWQALVTSAANKSLLCGAAIVSENAVVTAAHCVEDFRSHDLIIKAGVLKLFNPTEGAEQTRPVKAIARHPQFDAGSLAKDLAVLVIAPSFTSSQHVDKICLPQSGAQNSNKCVVTGWGRQALKAPVQNSVLHKVDVFFIDAEKCENTLRGTHLGKYFILNKGFSCAVPKQGSDLCKVDVGGPLACENNNGLYELAGVNSWDVSCSADETPTVFSNPDAEWIQQIIQTNVEKLAQDEELYNANKVKGESLDQVDIDQKPGFALGYGK